MVNNYITINEAAEILHLSISRVYHLRHKLPHIKCGGTKQARILFIRDKLIEAYQNIQTTHSNVRILNNEKFNPQRRVLSKCFTGYGFSLPFVRTAEFYKGTGDGGYIFVNYPFDDELFLTIFCMINSPFPLALPVRVLKEWFDSTCSHNKLRISQEDKQN